MCVALALLGTVVVLDPAMQSAASRFDNAAALRTGFGSHRHGSHDAASTSSKTPEPRHAPPPPETAEQHRAYLNRFGVGL